MGIAEKIIQNQDREGMLRRSLERIIQLYTDKSHFVYELLQNAEDAGAKSIRFVQYSDHLEVLHDGRPFTQANLQSLCDIGKSDKTEDLNQIGEFGVGFKSVFGICDTVKLYSTPHNYNGKEESACDPFSIEIRNFTLPVNIEYVAVPATYTTKFEFPYSIGFTFSGFKSIPDLNAALSSRLRNLGITTLLFMRSLESIEYEIRINGNLSRGVYLLQKERINDHCSIISAMGETESKEETLSYLRFSKLIDDTVDNRTVDIAFPVSVDKNGRFTFKETKNPYISVYFPTETESKLKFIVQGPYRTTPNRSSVPHNESENIKLARITATLLKESIRELRDKNQLNLSFLNVLPIDNEAFWTYDLFQPLYTTVKDLLSNEQFIPCRSGGYVSADMARIARNQSLPAIFDDTLLTNLINEPYHYKWLSTELTETNKQYKALYEYFTDVLDITVVRPEDLRTLFNDNPQFLMARNDEWLVRMYKMYESIPNIFGRGRSGTNMLTACFVKTSDGSFVAPYRRNADGNYLQNVFPPSQREYASLDIAFIDGQIFSQCKHFFCEILGLQAPKEYDLFIKDFKNRSESTDTISDIEHINDVKNLIHYLNSSDYGSDALDAIKESIKLVSWLNGNRIYANPHKSRVLFPKTKSNISIEAYYRDIVAYSYVDIDYYIGRGITYDQLAQLGVSEKIIIHDKETKGEYYSGNPGRQPQWDTFGDFRWKLNLEKIDDVLVHISTHPEAPDSMAKSQTIFKLLQANEKALEGKVYIGGSIPNIDPAYSEIVLTLTRKKTQSYRSSLWNGKWLYTESNELLASSDMSKSELNTNIYGKPQPDSILYRILGFKKDASDKLEEAIKDYDQFSTEKKQSFFELELHRRYGISDRDLQEQFGANASGTDCTLISQEPRYEFPTSSVRNWDSLKKHATEMFAFARPVQYEYLLRRIRTSNPNTSRTYLMGHYKANDAYKYACQMCHEFYPNVDACQLEEHPKDELEPLYVLLCPNCARKFKLLRADNDAYSRFYENLQAVNREQIESNSTIEVDINSEKMWFTQTHIAEIVELFKLRETVDKENPNPTSPISISHRDATSNVALENQALKHNDANEQRVETKPNGIDFTKCKGRQVKHKAYGLGIITDCSNAIVTIKFIEGKKVGEEVKFGLEASILNGYFELVD